jgi:pyruvate kinase
MLPAAARAARAAARAASPAPVAPPGSRSGSSLTRQLALDPSVRLSDVRATKIVATLGPACMAKLPALLCAGINVARINCAHGDRESYLKMVAAVKAAEAEVRAGLAAGAWEGVRPSGAGDVVAVAFDIKGPEIRVGRLAASVPAGPGGAKALPLARGARLVLTTNPAAAESGTAAGMYISYAALPRVVSPGQVIFVDDGNVALRVLEADAGRGTVTVESLTDLPLGERKNVNLPGLDVDLPAVTAKDITDIATAKMAGADILFASFVQSADAIREIRRAAGADMRIIAKIESQAGIDKIDEIISAADGIMVARGDLGVQIPGERVFLAQKMMIAKANAKGKPVIAATQMLESMVTHPRPTRAEVVDVASAVLDGADAVMLSGETAKGAFPLEAVSVMARTCAAAEAAYPARDFFTALSALPTTPVDVEHDEATLFHETVMVRNWLASSAAGGHEGGVGVTDAGGPPDHMTAADVETLASSAVHAAWETKAAAIVVLSVSGRTAAMVCKYRPPCPVVAVCGDEAVARQLQLRRGAQTVLAPPAGAPGGPPAASGLRGLHTWALRTVKAWGVAEAGQRVVMVHGQGAAAEAGDASGHTGVAVSLALVK